MFRPANRAETATAKPMDSGAQVFNRQDECIGVDKSEAYCVNDVVAERYSNAMPMDKIGGRKNRARGSLSPCRRSKMTFSDMFRQKYRVALCAARANDTRATLDGLSELCRLFADQYAFDNGDSIVVKAKLSYWQSVFGRYVDIIRKHGLQERRVQEFFGLNDDADVPSLGDILSGKGDLAVQFGGTKPDSDIDVDGIVDADGITQSEALIEDKPVVEPKAHNDGEQDKPEELTKPEEQPSQKPLQGHDAVGTTAAWPDEKAADCGANGAKRFEPDSLEDFIGQQHIVKTLRKEIAIAKAQGRKYLDNILLFGNSGLGKTTLMRLIAKALGVRFEWMDCSQYRNSQQSLKALQNFLMKVARENEPVVIAFDEIHMLNEDLQSSLLTLLNSRVYVSPPDVNGIVRRIPIDNFTFIAATTDDDKVLSTLKDRCLRLKFQMVDYTFEELERIYKNKVAAKGLAITDEAVRACIPRSRGSIRYVNSFVDGLDVMLYDDNGQRISTDIDADVVNRYFAERGVDAIGLEQKDLEILRALAEDPNGALGAETLAARVGLDPKKLTSEYEPYLIKIGFVNVTGRGRSLTDKAIQYLKEE